MPASKGIFSFLHRHLCGTQPWATAFPSLNYLCLSYFCVLGCVSGLFWCLGRLWLVQSPTEGRMLRLRLRMCVCGDTMTVSWRSRAALRKKYSTGILWTTSFLWSFCWTRCLLTFFPWPVLGAEDAGWSVLSPEDCAVRGCSWSLLDDLEAWNTLAEEPLNVFLLKRH